MDNNSLMRWKAHLNIKFMNRKLKKMTLLKGKQMRISGEILLGFNGEQQPLLEGGK